MRIAGTLTRGDLFVGHFLNVSSRPSLWALNSLPGLLIVATQYPEGAARLGPPRAIAILVAVFIAVTLACWLVSGILGGALLALRSGVVGPRCFEPSGDTLTVSSDVATSALKGTALSVVRGGLFGVLIQLRNGSGYFVPRRFFADRSQLQAFVATLRGFLRR